VTCNEEDTDGRARVTRDEERVVVCPDILLQCVLPYVLFGLPTLLLPPSGLHIMAQTIAGLVVGSRRMCPTNRLRRVATVSCSAACPVRAIVICDVVAP